MSAAHNTTARAPRKSSTSSPDRAVSPPVLRESQKPENARCVTPAASIPSLLADIANPTAALVEEVAALEQLIRETDVAGCAHTAASLDYGDADRRTKAAEAAWKSLRQCEEEAREAIIRGDGASPEEAFARLTVYLRATDLAYGRRHEWQSRSAADVLSFGNIDDLSVELAFALKYAIRHLEAASPVGACPIADLIPELRALIPQLLAEDEAQAAALRAGDAAAAQAHQEAYQAVALEIERIQHRIANYQANSREGALLQLKLAYSYQDQVLLGSTEEIQKEHARAADAMLLSALTFLRAEHDPVFTPYFVGTVAGPSAAGPTGRILHTADAELLALAPQLERRWAAERALCRLPDGQVTDEMHDAAAEHTGEIIRRIRSLRPETLAGWRVRARAVAWGGNAHDEPLDLNHHGDSAICAAQEIVNDLLFGHIPAEPAADPAPATWEEAVRAYEAANAASSSAPDAPDAEPERLARGFHAAERAVLAMPAPDADAVAYKLRLMASITGEVDPLDIDAQGWPTAGGMPSDISPYASVAEDVRRLLASLPPPNPDHSAWLVDLGEQYRKVERELFCLEGWGSNSDPQVVRDRIRYLTDLKNAMYVNSRRWRAKSPEAIRVKAMLALDWLPNTDNTEYDDLPIQLARSLVSDLLGLPSIDYDAEQLAAFWRAEGVWIHQDIDKAEHAKYVAALRGAA